jgi:integrase/recombinase XerD
MMAHCGLRRSEVASIDLDCVDLGGGGLVVPDSKRDAHRRLPLRDSVVQSLQVWLEYRGDGPGPLFCGISQQQVLTRARLSGEGVRWILGHIVARTRADYLSPIDLRRYFCTSRLEAGADLLAVSRLMGHASVETTMRYDMRGRRCLRDAVDMVRRSAPVDLRLGEGPAPYGHGFEKVA